MTITEISDIIIAILFVQAILTGWFRGLVRMVARLAAVFVSWLAASAVANAMKEGLARQYFLPMLLERVESGGWQSAAEPVLLTAAEQIAYVLVFLIVFCVLEFLLIHLVNLLKIIDEIPLIGLVNRLGGAIAGFFWIFFVLVLIGSIFFGMLPGDLLAGWGFSREAVEQTVLLKSFFPD